MRGIDHGITPTGTLGGFEITLMKHTLPIDTEELTTHPIYRVAVKSFMT
jgi:hypothetical protein